MSLHRHLRSAVRPSAWTFRHRQSRYFSLRYVAFWVLYWALCQAGMGLPSHATDPDPLPLGPRESLERLHLREGYDVQIMATEPAVMDPVAIDWGMDGSLWVVEMADYPLGMDGRGKPGGRIRRLEDTNHDGQYDQSHLFLDGIPFPTGVLSWGNGVLVTAAPEIFYAEDRDGDGAADVHQVLFSGFLEGNQQLRVNGLRWGLDNWVYCASGSHHAGYGKDSQILSHLTGARVSIGSRDFRIRPHQGLIDPQSGPSQYGRNRDDWGHWFGVQNSYPLWHYVLADHHLRRNPLFNSPDPRHQVLTPRNPRVYPAKPPQKRFHSFDQSGRFTSACSAMIYRDETLFGSGPLRHAFTCEPFHNLIQHNVVVEEGVSFRSYRDAAEEETDFFASADRWCRPVMARTGPDGALWVVDMYRYMIEHPEWLPDEGQDELRPHYRAGDKLGRIYRVFPIGQKPRRIAPLNTLSAQQLVAALEEPNGCVRDMAQRQLVLSASQETQLGGTDLPRLPDLDQAIPLLERLLAADDDPRTRVQALCTLDGLDAVDRGRLEDALQDPHAGVRRHAVRLADSYGVRFAKLVPLVTDPDLKVRLQLAVALGEFDDPDVARVMLALDEQSESEPFLQAALLSSVNDRNRAHLLKEVLAMNSIRDGSRRFVRELFAQFAQVGGPDEVGAVLAHVCKLDGKMGQPWCWDTVADMLDALRNRGLGADGSLDRSQRAMLQHVIERARALARDDGSPVESRVTAVRLLFRDRQERAVDAQIATGLLAPRSAPAVQRALIAHLALARDVQFADMLLAGWKSYSPSTRVEVLAAVGSREPWIDVLLDRLAHDAVLPSEIDPIARRRLLSASNAVQRQRFSELFSGATSPNRRAVIVEFQSALALAGDPQRGAILFRKKCTTCHKHEGVGHEVGPDLATLRNQSPQSLLTSTLDPSAAVEGKYHEYLVLRNDGRIESGLIATETGSAITLLAAEGKRVSILRREIDEVRSSGKSLMPDGLEKDLSQQDMADLIEFVRGLAERP